MAEDKATKDQAIKVDLSSWGDEMGPILKWQEAARTGDFMGMSRMMTGVVKSWPVEHDPSALQSYHKIDRATWKATAQAVGAAITTFFQG